MKSEPTFNLELYWQVLRRRKWLLLLPVVLLTGIVGLGSLLIPNIYQAHAQVVVLQETESVSGLAASTQITEQLGGVIQALQQPSVQKLIYQRLESAKPPGLTEAAALEQFRTSLTIRDQSVERVRLVDVVFTGTPEKYAVAVANAFAEEFRRQATGLVESSLVVGLEFVDDQLANYRQRLSALDTQERQLKQRLAGELGDLAPASIQVGLAKYLAERMEEGDNQVQKLDLEIDALAAQTTYLRSRMAVTPQTLALREGGNSDQRQAELERILAQARQARVTLGLKYTAQHPEVIALDRQIADLRQRLAEVQRQTDQRQNEAPNPAYETLQAQLTQAEAQLQFSRARRKTLLAGNDKLRRVATRLPELEQELQRVGDQREVLNETYQGLMKRKQALEVNQSFEEGRDSGRFELRPAGGTPLRPVRPNRAKTALLGFLGGLFIGLSFMLLAEYLDHAVRSQSDLRRYVDAPVLAVLPRAPR